MKSKAKKVVLENHYKVYYDPETKMLCGQNINGVSSIYVADINRSLPPLPAGAANFKIKTAKLVIYD